VKLRLAQKIVVRYELLPFEVPPRHTYDQLQRAYARLYRCRSLRAFFRRLRRRQGVGR
jgi:hypothetical protein